MIVTRHSEGLGTYPPDLSAAAVQRYRAAVEERYPGARWIQGRNFGRIVAGNLLLSLRFSLIDPQAEEMAWLDASQRLGDGMQRW